MHEKDDGIEITPYEAKRSALAADRGRCDPIPYQGRYQTELKQSSKIQDDTSVFEMDKDIGTVKSSRAAYRSKAVLPNLS
jgi:hypothetical protein